MALAISLVKVAHALSGFWFLAGIAGRGVVQLKAERTSDVGVVKVLVELLGRFDNLMVIPGSIAVLALGLVSALLEGIPLLGFLQGGSSSWLFASLLLYASIMALVPTVFLPKGRIFQVSLDEALAAGKVTERLSTTLRDPVVRGAHVWELLAIALIIWLMIAKPF